PVLAFGILPVNPGLYLVGIPVFGRFLANRFTHDGIDPKRPHAVEAKSLLQKEILYRGHLSFLVREAADAEPPESNKTLPINLTKVIGQTNQGSIPRRGQSSKVCHLHSMTTEI